MVPMHKMLNLRKEMSNIVNLRVSEQVVVSHLVLASLKGGFGPHGKLIGHELPSFSAQLV